MITHRQSLQKHTILPYCCKMKFGLIFLPTDGHIYSLGKGAMRMIFMKLLSF